MLLFSMAVKSFVTSKLWLMPFQYYNGLLERKPLLTKCITSGIMYGGGDVMAQYTEHYQQHKDDPSKAPNMTVNYKRFLSFFIFGTFVGGPSYHYWFNYLNELPAMLWRMKQSRHRGKILRAFAYLKAHNIEVKLDLSKLPKTEPLSKWQSKAAKILADQLIFSSTYTFVFFMAIGALTGSMDKLQIEYAMRHKSHDEIVQHSNNNRNEAEQASNNQIQDLIATLTNFISQEMEELQHTSTPSSSTDTSPQQAQLIRDMIRRLQTAQLLQANGLYTYTDIFKRSWAHCKEVYVETFLADCAVWPLLQLINFTFIPVKFQFLFVNVANLAWNTFLSLMANKKHS
ncbi:Mpv17/PMP22 family protein [archaeon]|nr:MAG: Mpv17/PMP22 family protein [archaeon]